ncbi:hypothetical protein [Anabaena sp. UHCC 0399]|uniref:hypothetical protein n=1 Tax=Anabaena sp. UHCC 0399 TaxID=3110238 RepID=UPI002B210D0D|nr:hypothetical protein [Anabaena sp. UHCC 0399]MEA5565944.1 hypothetical protein [Anabaena sp. UHCC 0399]
MSINKYQPHIFVLPEDDANRQIANGFILDPNLNNRAIQVLPPARGWQKVLEQFTVVHVPEMRKFSKRMIILLIDFDEQPQTRLSYIQNQIPEDLIDRVFVIGVLSEPENLRRDMRKDFEGIGEALALDCSENKNHLWEHNLLQHNRIELNRMISSVKPFLFN